MGIAVLLVVVVAAYFLVPRLVMRWSRARIRREVIAYLREVIPGVEISEETEDGLHIKTSGATGAQMSLSKLYGAIDALKPDTREARRALYERFTAPLQHPEEMDKLSIEEHGSRILPRIVNSGFAHEVEDKTNLPMRALGFTGLSVAYVLDSEHHVAYLTRSHAAQLGLDDPALHELALANLRKIFKPQTLEGALKGESLSIVQSFDDHDAARLLLVPEHLAEDQTVVAFIPDKGTLIVSPAPTDGDWGALHGFTPGIASLYDRPLKVTRHGIELVPHHENDSS